MPVRLGTKGRAIENGTAEAAGNVLLAPGIGNDVVIIQIAMLRDVSGHPVSGTLKSEEIEHTVVNRRAALRFLP